ncbi:hypothetical protein COOONC_10973 [Cooperia oncophora]
MASTDEMDFYERTKSFIGHILTVLIWKKTFADESRQNFSDGLIQTSLTYSYELTRPTLAKIVNIGGIGMQLKDARPLSSEFQKIVDHCEGLVVFSFGSVAPSHLMPESWKKAFLEAFGRFPKLHFVLRYEGADLKDRLPPNVHLFKWLPPAICIGIPKTVGFHMHIGWLYVYRLSYSLTSLSVPPIVMASTDEMDFYERTKSFIGHILTVLIWKKTFADEQTELFRRIDPDFPHIVDLVTKAPLVMVNSNELYELTRPTLAKIVNIGGIGMQLKDARPLSSVSSVFPIAYSSHWVQILKLTLNGQRITNKKH